MLYYVWWEKSTGLTKQKKGGQVGNSCTVSRYWMDLGHRVNHYTYII